MMRAAFLINTNKPLVLAEPQPCELQYGQVFVRILASGICGAQLMEIRGDKGSHFPRLMGHEGAGIIERIGPGVKTVKEGQRVVMHWRKGDGIESDSPRYRLNGSEITGGQVVTFATHSICSENRLTAVPDDCPVELAALLGCGLSTAIGTIEQEAKLLMGERVLIIGCGGLGLNLIRAAKMRRASCIRAVDNVPKKGEAAFTAGADSFACDDWSNVAEVDEFDVVVDTTGNPYAIELGMVALAPSGRFIMVGQPSGDITIRNGRSMFHGEGCSIKATQGGGFRPHLDLPRYYALWKSGQLDIDGIVTHRIPFDMINDGIELVQQGNAGRVLLQMDR